MTAAPPGARGAGRAALHLGTVLGVPVELAPSWFLLAAVVVLSYGPQLDPGGQPGRGYLSAAAFALLLLASVLLHELGHCVVARLARMRVRRVTVSFLAGLTEFVDPAPTPGRACAVSIAGPGVSVLLTLAGFLAAEAFEPGSSTRAVLGLFALTNAGLAVFNLLPGLPLDGGAVLRSVVWRVTGSAATGTLVSAYAGLAVAVAVVPLALFAVEPLLGAQLTPVGIVMSAFVALFLYAGASAALRQVRGERRLVGLSAAALARPALTVTADTSLAETLRRAAIAGLRAVVVVDSAGRPTGVVSESAVAAVPEHRRAWLPVADLARPLSPGLVLDPDLAGADLLAAAQRTPATEYLLAGPTPRVLARADLGALVTGAVPTGSGSGPLA